MTMGVWAGYIIYISTEPHGKIELVKVSICHMTAVWINQTDA